MVSMRFYHAHIGSGQGLEYLASVEECIFKFVAIMIFTFKVEILENARSYPFLKSAHICSLEPPCCQLHLL